MCAECNGKVSGRRYCGKACRDAANRRRQRAAYLSARKIIERACAGCGADITERASSHPLATRCDGCQKRHRSGRKRRRVVRTCSGCGASIRGRARGKTTCTDCEPKPPRLCIGCGSVDLRGTSRWRCDDCRAEWGSGRVRQWQEDHPEATMLIRARSRARQRGIECTITVEDIRAAWPGDGRCPVFGVELIRNLGEPHASPYSPSIDRIDNAKGYVPGNIHVISVRANGVKQDFTIEELAAGMAGPEWQAWAA